MSLRQQNKARTRARILQAAVELIAEAGLAAATTRDMANRAGVSYQTLYNYFPGKRQVVQALLTEDLELWSLGVDACIKRYNGDLLSTLAEINRLGLAQFDGPKQDLWREVGGAMLTGGFPGDELEHLNQVSHDRFYALLSIAQGTGELRGELDLHLLAHTLFCLSDYAVLRHFAATAPDAEQTIGNLQEQQALLLAPYLTRRSGGDAEAASARSGGSGAARLSTD